MKIYNNEYFSLFSEDNEIYILVSKSGYNMQNFNSVILDNPTIQLSNFLVLKKALEEANSDKTPIGILKPRVNVIISNDEMEAKIILNITKEEIEQKKSDISSEIIETLNDIGVTEGIYNIFDKPIYVQKEMVIAKGIPPTDGDDAILKYYQLSEKKPIVQEDGSVNHYELNLIDNVEANNWLGERIPPTDGKPGKTVNGKLVPAKRGRDAKLKYDPKTVALYEENGKDVLRALVDGAVKFDGDKIRVDNLLVISGNVGYETGNIDFDGYVTIMGTVNDGFSVNAKCDIEVKGKMGIGTINKIVSTEGSIYIKGGIYGKSTALLHAKKDVFIKYCNECTITAGNDINIGFYSLDSHLTAKRILMDPVHGKIIGGSINAEIQVIAGVIGNRSEKKTQISVQGFDRLSIKKEFEALLVKYKDLLSSANKAKRQLEVFEYSMSGSEYINMGEYQTYIRKYESIVDDIKVLDEYRKKLQNILETKGEGEIGVFKAAYPETFIEIKSMTKKINSIVSGSFYVVNKELHHG